MHFRRPASMRGVPPPIVRDYGEYFPHGVDLQRMEHWTFFRRAAQTVYARRVIAKLEASGYMLQATKLRKSDRSMVSCINATKDTILRGWLIPPYHIMVALLRSRVRYYGMEPRLQGVPPSVFPFGNTPSPRMRNPGIFELLHIELKDDEDEGTTKDEPQQNESGELRRRDAQQVVCHAVLDMHLKLCSSTITPFRPNSGRSFRSISPYDSTAALPKSCDIWASRVPLALAVRTDRIYEPSTLLDRGCKYLHCSNSVLPE